tara:strand:- start:361 stop:522 length:162 start_codon:yes stop_codon:yes gene_type:complete
MIDKSLKENWRLMTWQHCESSNFKMSAENEGVSTSDMEAYITWASVSGWIKSV